MHRAGAEPEQGVPMFGCAVSLMRCEVVSRIAPVKRGHKLVAEGFGQNRRGRDGQHAAVSLDNRVLRRQTDGQATIRNAVVAVNQDGPDSGNIAKSAQGSGHGQKRGLQDIEPG